MIVFKRSLVVITLLLLLLVAGCGSVVISVQPPTPTPTETPWPAIQTLAAERTETSANIQRLRATLSVMETATARAR